MNNSTEKRIDYLFFGLALIILSIDGLMIKYIWNSLINYNSILFDISYLNSIGLLILLTYLDGSGNSFLELEDENYSELNYFKKLGVKFSQEISKRVFLFVVVFLINLFA